MLLKIVVDLQTLPEGDAHGKKVTPKDRHEKRKKEIRSLDTVLVFLSGPIRAHNHGPQLQETQPADLVGECGQRPQGCPFSKDQSVPDQTNERQLAPQRYFLAHRIA